jgi:hypothetical protein
MIPRKTAGRNAPAKQNKPIYVNGRVIGYVTAGAFSKAIAGSKHMLRSPRAICFDRCTVRDAAAAGATFAAILDRETGKTYTASFETIDEYGFAVRRGHGDQVGLALDFWSVNGATPLAEQRAAQTNQERKELQVSFFAGEAL